MGLLTPWKSEPQSWPLWMLIHRRYCNFCIWPTTPLAPRILPWPWVVIWKTNGRSWFSLIRRFIFHLYSSEFIFQWIILFCELYDAIIIIASERIKTGQGRDGWDVHPPATVGWTKWGAPDGCWFHVLDRDSKPLLVDDPGDTTQYIELGILLINQ